ncbi:unnamed protein product [Vicia faba]|uniref:DUF4283 domain-containing protein n=1 Tax=Vicia faba TaxID=3906 RepID=A0AAV0YJS9_VICFA|nr:unnamed protein product [Vicia faba]
MGFSKAMKGVVNIPGSTFRMQSILDKEGFSSIKASALGPCLLLLEESKNGALEELLGECDARWKVWFSEVRRWNNKEMDKERLIRVKVYGVPCFAWHRNFFVALANSFDKFVCLDEYTSNGRNFDTARITLIVKLSFILQESCVVI